MLHAGVYYKPGSLKAQLCVQGKAAMERFADEHGIGYETCGKLIVALDESELGRLADLEQRGQANGVPGLRMVGPEELREIEPHAAGIRALHSPGTGIIDFGQVVEVLTRARCDARASTSTSATRSPVCSSHGRRSRWCRRRVATSWRAGWSRCAGLHSDRVARLDSEPTSQIVPVPGRLLHADAGGRGICAAA